MTRSAALRSHGGARGAGADPAPAVSPPAAAPSDPSRTAPPPQPTPGTKPAAAAPAPAGSDTTRKRRAKADAEATLDLLLKEVRALRESQDLVLRALADLRRAIAASSPAAEAELDGPAAGGAAVSPIRDARRKTVMLVDDDPRTREDAVAELRRAEVPVRVFDDGNAALCAIAEAKPDVIALELGLGGAMGGKDLVNLIKATMEWVDIPIVLWTREGVTTQKEARQVHGADEVVPKSSGPAALLACIIDVFRR